MRSWRFIHGIKWKDKEDTWLRSEFQFWPPSFKHFLKITKWGHCFANIEAFLGGGGVEVFWEKQGPSTEQLTMTFLKYRKLGAWGRREDDGLYSGTINKISPFFKVPCIR